MFDLIFSVRGNCLPSDHNYGLYASMVSSRPELRHLDWQLGTITGLPDGKGLIKLGDQSNLLIRGGLEVANLVANLTQVRVGNWVAVLDPPKIIPITEQHDLSARIVVIKGAETPQQLSTALLTQSEQLGISGCFIVGDRRKIKVKRFTVVGFSVLARVEGKSSLTLQKLGLGGKRKMGCGVFCG